MTVAFDLGVAGGFDSDICTDAAVEAAPIPAGRPRLYAVPAVAPGRGGRPARSTCPSAAAAAALPAGANVRVLRAPADADRVPLRLTRRGVAVLAFALVLLCAGLVWVAAASAPSDAGSVRSGPAVVAVHQGDTLWAIASRVAAGQDPRAVVDRLQQLNHLDGAVLQPGQQLRTR